MIKRNIKTINCDVLFFIYLFQFFIRLILCGLKALHTKHCFSLYNSFINSSYVLATQNAVFFASVSTGVQFIFMYHFYQRRSSCLFCILIFWFIVCPPVLSELWTAADCPGVKGSVARYPSFNRSTAGFLVCRTSADCRGVIGIAALYSSVSRTTEEIVESIVQRQFVLESALLNVSRPAAPCSGVRTL
jgi:hypothetical protein